MSNLDIRAESNMKSGYVDGNERKPTDCFFCILFLAFLMALVTISFIGIAKGNWRLLVAGTDADGHICGSDVENGAYKDYRNVYYMTGLSNGLKLSDGAICVKDCPNKDAATLNCVPTTNVPNCQISQQYATVEFIGYCLPSKFGDNNGPVQSEWDKVMGIQAVNNFFKDLDIASTAIYVSFVLGLFYTLCYLYFLSSCAHVLAYVAIGLLEVIMIAGIGGLAYGLSQVGNDADAKKGYYIAIAINAFFLLLFNCLMCCFWSKLQVAIAVIDCTADFMAATKRIALLTIYFFLLSIVVTVIWAFGLVGTISMNEITAVRAEDGNGYVKQISWTGGTTAMLCMMIFGFIWVIAFISDQARFVYMLGASQYYYSSGPEGEGSASLMGAVSIANTKHSGSLALGSLLHTIVVVLRMIVDAIVNASEKQSGDNAAVKIIGCLLKCCVRCLESLIEYLNATAYAYMSVSGDPYCRSAWNGFLINLKHLMEFYFADVLAGMFVFIGVLLIVGLNMGSCFLIMRYGLKNSDKLGSIWVPLALIGVTTLITAELFIGFFHQALKATLMSMAIDIELHGKATRGSPSFHEKMERINGKSDDDSRG